jgi:transposase-like protein
LQVHDPQKEDSPRSDALRRLRISLLEQSEEGLESILEPFVDRSHEAIRQWVVQRLAPVCDGLDVDRRLVRKIFVDETMIRIRGRQACGSG